MSAKIYTKTGDQGTTGLGNRQRVPKNSSLIEALGSIDELNSTLGMIIAMIETPSDIKTLLIRLQQDLLNIGAELSLAIKDKFTMAHSHWLENQIDQLDQKLKPIKHFILPGGNIGAATCHLARTICRRAERHAWQAQQEYSLNKYCLIYLNRLSDLLFTIARYINQAHGIEETAWNTVN